MMLCDTNAINVGFNAVLLAQVADEGSYWSQTGLSWHNFPVKKDELYFVDI